MKELGAQWLVALHDNPRNRPQLISNRFKEVSIVAELKKTDEHSDEDSFSDLDYKH